MYILYWLETFLTTASELLGALLKPNHLYVAKFVLMDKTADEYVLGFVDDTNVYRVTMYVNELICLILSLRY